MNSQLRQQVIDLRTKEELSYGEIRKRLGVPKSTLSYWLREFPLNAEKILELRRKGWGKGEASREKFRATMREKRVLKEREVYEKQRRKLSNISDDAFFVAGLMLYLGEGDKKNSSRIALANTDHWVIAFFIKWMNDFLGIARERVRIQLHLYENMDIKGEQGFWRDKLNLAEEQFYKPEIRKLKKASFSYRGSLRHGTCSIFVSGVEKKMEIMMAIQAFLDIYQERIGS